MNEGVAATEKQGSDDIFIRDRKGAESRIRYRNDVLIEEIVRPSGKSTKFDYDPSSHLVRSIEYPGGVRHQFVRNSLGQVATFDISGKSKYSFTYNGEHRVSRIQYPDDRHVGFEWSDSGSLRSFTDRCGNTSQYHHHQEGDWVTDTLGRKRVYKTDTEGRLEALVFPDGTREEYAFDEESNVIEVIQRNGSSIRFELNDQGSPNNISWQDGSELELKFDDKDRLVAAKAGEFQVDRVYTEHGQIALEGTIAGPVEYQHDPNGRMSSYATPFGDKVQFEYDDDGLLIGIIDWEKRRIQIDYAGNDTPSQFTFPNGVIETQAISSTPYRASTILQGRSGMISEHTIEADECDRVRRVNDRWGLGRSDWLDRRLEYDKEDRLVEEINVPDGNSIASFAYDAVGNMIQDNGLPVEFAAMNQPTKRGNHPIDYDGLGNASRLTTSCGQIEATFTEDNRLRAIKAPRAEYRYEYDGLCRRIRKTNGKETWTYGWSGSQLLWEDYTPAPNAEGIRRDYLYLPNCSTPIAFREHGKTYWIQSDFRGAVIAVHDEEGAIVWRGVYESFGSCKTPVNQVRQPWRLAGQYLDEESGLHYNLARYYCPTNKTYLSLDPRWQEPEATNYSYARNDPWNRADPLGMIAPLVIVGAVALVSGTISAIMAPKDEKLGAFLGGAAAGAIGTAAGLAAVAMGATAAVAIAVGLGAAIVGGAVDGLINAALKPGPICWPCVAEAAGISLAAELLTLGLAKFIPTSVKKSVANAIMRMGGRFKTAIAKAFSKGGMRPDHLANLADYAKRSKQLIISRGSKKAALDHHGNPNLGPKPVTVSQKTAENGLTPPIDGKQYYSDYDLMSVHKQTEIKPDGSPHYSPVDTNDAGFIKQVNDEVTPDQAMFQHGANDDYIKGAHPDGKPIMGNTDIGDEFIVAKPDGSVQVLNQQELKSFYKENGLEWNYD